LRGLKHLTQYDRSTGKEEAMHLEYGPLNLIATYFQIPNFGLVLETRLHADVCLLKVELMVAAKLSSTIVVNFARHISYKGV
jgi:hypothetical protein